MPGPAAEGPWRGPLRGGFLGVKLGTGPLALPALGVGVFVLAAVFLLPEPEGVYAGGLGALLTAGGFALVDSVLVEVEDF